MNGKVYWNKRVYGGGCMRVLPNELIEHTVTPILHVVNDFIFQHDNFRVHIAKITQ